MNERIVETSWGDRYYYDEYNRLHRAEGPAIEFASGYKEWYRNGKKHRVAGPAVIWPDGYEVYYLNDKEYDKEAHDRLVKLKIFW